MTAILLVAAGGFFGAMARFAVGQWMARNVPAVFPFGTLTVNLLGSFLLGIITGLHINWISYLFGTGFMGAFTTFSTLKFEGIQLWAKKKTGILLLYYGISYTFGILLAFLGYALAKS